MTVSRGDTSRHNIEWVCEEAHDGHNAGLPCDVNIMENRASPSPLE